MPNTALNTQHNPHRLYIFSRTYKKALIDWVDSIYAAEGENGLHRITGGVCLDECTALAGFAAQELNNKLKPYPYAVRKCTIYSA